ncbi:hypothetical protein HNQ51_000208 [Inhella inkyongensis]|uniref:Histidine kinase n=1 Tax=Inhella inkyongensis TaxID=392593 RepID=A0A840RY85_9BURK|nr:histidine kinase [Inhella inkyongensis]MBB5202915.1 hypothetical protein [Inhella inkyongensis]
MTTPNPRPWYLDWTQWICPGPRRRFSAQELTRAGAQPWPKGIDAYVALNLLTLLAINLKELPRPWAPWALLVLGGLWALSMQAARWLWRQPTRRNLNLALGLGLVLIVGGLLGLRVLQGPLRSLQGAERQGLWVLVLLGVACGVMAASALWFLVLYRVQQIEARLTELDGLDAQLALQRRLATAQIHPHFVFNTLASLTHWVETQDPRAAPLLRDFSAYLRATLPLFERDQLPLREELELVRRYLAIMQARMGERLRWRIVDDAALDELPLPPGSLLTLVENAITHGIEPSLRGGEIEIRCARVNGGAQLQVLDSGQGLQPTDAAPGLGLANTRERLLALHGPQATLSLSERPEGGCLALMTLPSPP